MRILALITARGGSKRLPGKNIQMLGGKPLIAWSIDVAKNIPEICDILVSTDNSEIASISVDAGAYVPWLRPAELALDTTTSVDVAIHAMDEYEAERGKVDGLLLLQPTSPFRTKGTILKGIDLFKKNAQLPVLGVSPTHVHPMWTLKMEGNYIIPFIKGGGLNTRSQDLLPAYIVNGSFYLISPAELRKNRSFIGRDTIPLTIESQDESLDIDTDFDFKMAELMVVNYL